MSLLEKDWKIKNKEKPRNNMPIISRMESGARRSRAMMMN